MLFALQMLTSVNLIRVSTEARVRTSSTRSPVRVLMNTLVTSVTQVCIMCDQGVNFTELL